MEGSEGPGAGIAKLYMQTFRGDGWVCLASWSLWWLQMYKYILKLILLCTLNMCSFSKVNYTSIKMSFLKKQGLVRKKLKCFGFLSESTCELHYLNPITSKCLVIWFIKIMTHRLHQNTVIEMDPVTYILNCYNKKWSSNHWSPWWLVSSS